MTSEEFVEALLYDRIESDDSWYQASMIHATLCNVNRGKNDRQLDLDHFVPTKEKPKQTVEQMAALIMFSVKNSGRRKK